MKKLCALLLSLGFTCVLAQQVPIRVIPLDAESYAAMRQNNATKIRVVYPREDQGFPFQDISLHSKDLLASGFLAELSPVARVVNQETLIDSFILDGKYIQYRDSTAHRDTLIWGFGEYRKGRKHGTWTWLYDNKQASAIEGYEEGRLLSVKYFKPSGEPEPLGHIGDSGPRALNLNAIKASIPFPEQAKRNGREGYVFVKVLVDTNGVYVKHKYMTYSHELFRDAVEPHLSRLRFQPLLLHNELRRTWVTIPFVFRVQ